MNLDLKSRVLSAIATLACGGLACLAVPAVFAGEVQLDGEIYVTDSTGYVPGRSTPHFYDNLPDVGTPSVGQRNVTPANAVAWGRAHTGTGGLFLLADPATQTLRATAVAVGDHSGSTGVEATTRLVQRQVTVGAGTSGLAQGSPLTLTFSLRLDGTFLLGSASTATDIILPEIWSVGAWALTSMRYEVFRFGDDGHLLDMRYTAEASYGGGDPGGGWGLYDANTFHANGRYSTDGGWTYQSFGTIDIDDSQVIPWSPVGHVEREVDTGTLVMTLDVAVGDVLAIDTFLHTEATGSGVLPMLALNDFGATFDAEITASAPGVELLGLTGGVGPVPEPGTGALMLAGLSVATAVARRRR